MHKRIRLSAIAALMFVVGCASVPKEPPVEDQPSQVAAQLIDQGDKAARKADFLSAMEFYRQAVVQEPSVDGWMRVGAAAQALGSGRANEALYAYAQVVALDPTHVDAWQEIGDLQLAAKNFDAARQAYVSLLTANRSQWRAYNGLGVISDYEGEPERAIAYYRDALDLNPTSAIVLNNLGYARFRVGHLDTAVEHLKSAIAQDPGYRPAWVNLGRVYAVKRRYPDALSVMMEAMAAPDAYNEIGYIAMRQDDLDIAESYLRQAVDSSPTYFEAAYANLKEVTEAIAKQRRARARG